MSLKKSCIICHPGTQHSPFTAKALEDAGLLDLYLTGFYYVDTNPTINFLMNFSIKLKRQLLRRRPVEISRNKVKNFPFFEFFSVLVAKAFPKQQIEKQIKIGRQIRLIRNNCFAIYANRVLERRKPKVVIAYEGLAYNILRNSPDWQLKILDHTSGTLAKANSIYREESQRNPEFASNFPQSFPKKMITERTVEMELADIILVSSDYMKKNIIELGIPSKKIRFLPYGVDLTRFSPKIPSKKQAPLSLPLEIIYVGNLSQHKGIKYLIQSVKQFSEKQVRLTLLGLNLIPTSIIDSLPPNIRILPNVPNHEVPQFLQNSELFVFPAIHEGSSRTIYEAMATGLPIITTPNSGSIVKDGKTGFIVSSGDVNMINSRIRYFLNNPMELKTMGKAARYDVINYSWNKYGERLAQIIEKAYVEKRQKN
jgi:glycosyltransferase involved in cell wall biosynthesis